MKSRLFPLLFLLTISLSGLLTGCSDDEDEKKEEVEIPVPVACLYENTITISDIVEIPENVTFDRIKADITGADWQIIETIEAIYKEGSAVLVLPSTFTSDKLMTVDRSGKDKYGYWPATTDNPDALVAQLGDMFLYNGTKKVGRVFLSDWPRKGSSAGKAFIYYHFANSKFTLSGSNKSYFYRATFEKGWNAYANINPTSEEVTGNILCTTTIPTDIDLRWRIESYVY